MKKLALLLISTVLLFSCTTAKLRHRLPKDIRQWYDLHHVLMDAKVPRWIYDGNKTERLCFLCLPEKAQRTYISVFWKVRTEGLADEFYGRAAIANKFFSREGKIGWKTDRGRTLVLCGFPHFQRYITIHDLAFQNRNNQNWRTPSHSNEGYVYEFWSYIHRGRWVQYRFVYSPGNSWKNTHTSTFSLGDQVNFEKDCKKIFAPTEEGWDMIGGWVHDWTRK